MLIVHGANAPEPALTAVFRPHRFSSFAERPLVSLGPDERLLWKNDNLPFDRNVTALSVELPEIYADSSASIVIPTYNERENVLELLERIHRSMGSLGAPLRIVIVDDDSPDETWKVASQQSNGDRVRVIRRHGERGLATRRADGDSSSEL